jgi:diaminohydroxyphosphoribosylaminopyrimidine deaminase / 5-amino-6-(5-phosphoribosylamino)uracil reductase
MTKSIETTDLHYMKRCLQLARNGFGRVAPNPMVGSVIVHNGKIIGEGYHRHFGEPHAEVNAIRSVQNKSLLRESTLYVNLEPCAHHGKTPPCADLIVQQQIPKVVIGSVDTFSEVSGRGITRLRNAGIEVLSGVLNNECRFLNRRFFTFHEQKRPYIILKWAQTIDGFVDVLREQVTSRPTWITNNECRMLVHKWRSEEMAILVGTHTALLDNPKLNIRSWEGKAPTRLVIDRKLKLPENLNLFDGTQPTSIFSVLPGKNQNVSYISVHEKDSLTNSILTYCHQNNLQSVIIEGGTLTLKAFLEEGLWDEARIFTGNVFFNNGIKAPTISHTPQHTEKVGNSKLNIYLNYKN